MNECAPAVLAYAVWGLIVLATAAFAWFVGLYRVHQASYRGQAKSVVASVASQAITFQRNRLRYKQMGYSYADRGDTPWYPPAKPEAATDTLVEPLERRYPELAKRLQETAVRLAREKGTITSDDVWDACPIPSGIEPKLMAAAFKPRDLWRKTGQYVPTRRPSANRRPIPCWELREAA